MRPSSTRKLMPSSATVFPNDLRRPRASMQAIASALLFFFCGTRAGRIRDGGFLRRLVRGCDIGRCLAGCPVQEFFRFQAEPLNVGVNAGPFVSKKFLPLALQQQIARAVIDEHADRKSTRLNS